MLKFGASKSRIKGGGAWAPGAPLDPRLRRKWKNNPLKVVVRGVVNYWSHLYVI